MPRDFLSQYLAYTAENEAPEVFHTWCAIAILGHALNRKVWLDRHLFKLWPGTIMVCLISDSAVSRKTTAINIAVQLLETLLENDINVVEGKKSSASLFDAFDLTKLRGPLPNGDRRDSIGLIVADELGSFLSRESFADQLATDITQMNTAREGSFKRIMRSGTVELWNVCQGMLAGTTPTGLAHEIPKVAQQAGLFGRMLLIYSEETDRINPLTEAPTNHGPLKAWLMRDLARISQLSGPFTFTASGKHFFEDWYRTYKLTKPGSDASTGFYGRKADHVLRTAMVLAASRGSALILDETVLNGARMLIEDVELRLPEAHRKLGASVFSEAQEKILAMIIRKGGKMSHAQVASGIWRVCSGPDLKKAIFGLIDASTIEVEAVETNGVKKALMYKLVQTRGDMLASVRPTKEMTEEEWQKLQEEYVEHPLSAESAHGNGENGTVHGTTGNNQRGK